MFKRLLKNNRLLRSTAIRLSLRYAFYFALVMILGLGSLYWASSRYIDAQISTSLENQLAILVQLDRQQGRQQLINQLNKNQKFSNINRLFKLLISKNSNKLAGDLLAWPDGVIANGEVQNNWINSDKIPISFPDNDGYWPTIAITLADGSKLLLTQSVVQAEDLREFTLTAMSIILFFTMSLTLLLGWRLSKRMFKRIDDINIIAREVGQGALTKRVPLTGRNDEFDELANHLNEMLQRLEQLLNGMQEVSDNIAHDLRSPLTRLRNHIELCLEQPTDAMTYQQALNHALTDIDYIIKTFNALLEITQIESGSFQSKWILFNLSEQIQNIAELYKDSAEDKNKSFTINIMDNIKIKGDQYLINQAISNLLENALKYSPKQGKIAIDITDTANQIIITVSDNGNGITKANQKRVLQRFVRLDSARNTAGNGLGLSLVKAVVDLHHGKLMFINKKSSFSISFILYR